MSLAYMVDEILANHGNQSLTQEEILDKFAERESFKTAQIFCVWVADALTKVAVVGSSETANDDGQNHLLALVTITIRNETSVVPLRATAHLDSIIETYGLDNQK